MPPSRESNKATIKVPSLYNGISMQPPHLRLQNQVAYAANAVFSVIDGVSKRPPTIFQFYLGSSLTTPTVNYRLHTIVRDVNERYVVVYGGNATTIVRIFVVGAAAGAEEADVTINSTSQTYFDYTGTTNFPDRLRVYSAADTTFWINTQVTPTGTDTSGTTTGATVANPTEITTGANHGLSTGDTVIIADTNTNASINGTNVITVTAVNKFTIPVNVSAVTSATGTWTNAKLSGATMPQSMIRVFKATIGSSITIVGNSAADPTTVTTATAHGLTAGQRIVISGSTTAAINGSGTVVSTPTTTTFTMANAGGIGGAATGGTLVGIAKFTIDPITWNQRIAGTSTTNPRPPFIVNGYKITDLALHKSRLAFLVQHTAFFSQANDLYNLFITDPSNVTDADPIRLTLGESQIIDGDFFVQIRQALLVFAKGGRQLEITARDAFTQANVGVTPATSISALSTRPCKIDPAVYFATENASSAQLREFIYDEVSLPSTADEVSSHVRDLMFLLNRTTGGMARIKTMTAIPQSGVVCLLRTQFGNDSYEGFDIFVYSVYYGADGKKAQSAWTRFDMTVNDNFTDSFTHDIASLGNDLYILRSHSLAGTYYFYVEKMQVEPQSSHRVT